MKGLEKGFCIGGQPQGGRRSSSSERRQERKTRTREGVTAIEKLRERCERNQRGRQQREKLKEKGKSLWEDEDLKTESQQTEGRRGDGQKGQQRVTAKEGVRLRVVNGGERIKSQRGTARVQGKERSKRQLRVFGGKQEKFQREKRNLGKEGESFGGCLVSRKRRNKGWKGEPRRGRSRTRTNWKRNKKLQFFRPKADYKPCFRSNFSLIFGYFK